MGQAFSSPTPCCGVRFQSYGGVWMNEELWEDGRTWYEEKAQGFPLVVLEEAELMEGRRMLRITWEIMLMTQWICRTWW